MINSKNQKVAFSIALFSFGGLLLLLSSCFIYLSFYNNYIPPLASDAKVYFDYTFQPNARIPLSSLGLMNDQQYTFSLKLNVPNSPHNFGLGNFMVYFNLLDAQNNTISTTSRPGLVTYKSTLLLTLTTIASSLWLLIGSKSESQMIQIPLLELYSPSSKDSWIQLSLSTKDLHILEASLGIKTYLRGLRYFMYEWAFVTGILLVSLILVAQIAILWGIYETILTWDDTSVKERTIKLKKKKSKLSRKSSSDTVRLDSSYASYASRTVTPVNEEASTDIKNVYYPETPSPWENARDTRDNLQDSEPLANRDSLCESLMKEESNQDESNQEESPTVVKDSSNKINNDDHQGTCYSFFPKADAGASSYSMPFTAIPGDLPASLDTMDHGHINESVNSWREGLDEWSE